MLQGAQKHGGWRDPEGINKLLQKQCLPVSIWNKNYLSKQVVAITYTLDKMFFEVATFEGLGVISF